MIARLLTEPQHALWGSIFGSPVLAVVITAGLGAILELVRRTRQDAKRERAEAALHAKQQADDVREMKSALLGRPATEWEEARPGIKDTVDELAAAYLADGTTRALYEQIRLELRMLNEFVAAWRDVWNRNVERARAKGMTDIEDAPPFPGDTPTGPRHGGPR